MTPCAPARNPTDSVTGDETVKVSEGLINVYKLNLLDFGGSLQDSLGCGSQLTKPSELGVRANLGSWRYIQFSLI